MAEFFWSEVMLIIAKEYFNDTFYYNIITFFWSRDTAACKNQFVDVISCSLCKILTLLSVSLILSGHIKPLGWYYQ